MSGKEDVETGERRKESDYDVLRIGFKSKTYFMHVFIFIFWETCFMHAEYINTMIKLRYNISGTIL